MLNRSSCVRAALTLTLSGALVAACSSSDDDDASSGGDERVSFTVAAPQEIAAPAVEGNGVNMPQPAAPLPEGYVLEEQLIGGTATSFAADDAPDDGHWDARPDDEA